jgi:stage V sporulation protein B
MSKFLKGTIILLVAGFVTRVLGFINRIVIARFIGEEGVGLYMMAFPTLILIVTVTQLGLPVAISKNIAEAEAKGDTKKIKQILVVSLATTFTLSLIYACTVSITNSFYRSAYAFTTARDCSNRSNCCTLFSVKRIFSRQTKYEAVCYFTGD